MSFCQTVHVDNNKRIHKTLIHAAGDLHISIFIFYIYIEYFISCTLWPWLKAQMYTLFYTFNKLNDVEFLLENNCSSKIAALTQVLIDTSLPGLKLRIYLCQMWFFIKRLPVTVVTKQEKKAAVLNAKEEGRWSSTSFQLILTERQWVKSFYCRYDQVWDKLCFSCSFQMYPRCKCEYLYLYNFK